MNSNPASGAWHGWPEGLRVRGPGYEYADCASIQQFLYTTLFKDTSFDKNIEVEVDRSFREGAYKISLTLNGKSLCKALIHWERGIMEVGDLLKKNLGILCAVHQTELEKICPSTIKGIEAYRNDQDIFFVVKFKNGHEITADSTHMMSSEFKAHCLMVHDLPPT